MTTREEAWPPLPLAEWQATYDTLHLWLQIVGKTRLALSPHCNHWWEVPLYLTARGLTTSPVPYAHGAFEARFDFISRELILETSRGPSRRLPLSSRSVAGFYADYLRCLGELGIEVSIWPVPVEMALKVPFDQDGLHRAYDAEHAHRFWRALLSAHLALEEFRGRFQGKESPVHFFWGSCDLALTRFSGRRAPERPEADFITREAYSHEVISAGWWPGGSGQEAAFYVYAAPEPEGFSAARPPRGAYDAKLKEFLLPYDEVRLLPDPKKAVLEFMQGAYEAGATLGRWDRPALERPRPWPTA